MPFIPDDEVVTPEVVVPIETNIMENVYDKPVANPWLLYMVIAFGLFLLWGDE